MRTNIYFLLCSVLVFLTFSVSAQTFTIDNGTTGSQTFTSDGTVVVSSGVTTTVQVQLWGSGAGGGNTGTDGTNGGGGGGYTDVTTMTLTEGSYTVTVGAGAGPGSDGNASLFNGASAAGGFASGGGGVGSTSTGGAGGAAAKNAGGGGGEGACTSASGGAGLPGNGNLGGLGGSSCDGGDGGAGGDRDNSGLNGIAVGGGGGGKGRFVSTPGLTAGSGADGQVIITVISALPVELTHFSVEAIKHANVLSWETSSEQNNDRFEILRKRDSDNQFSKLAEIDGVGTSNILNEYTYVDYSVLRTEEYCYKLNQIDIDGVNELSKTVCTISEGETSRISVYPNPFHSELTIRYDGGTRSSTTENLELWTVYGDLIHSYKIGNEHPVVISTLDLLSGVYIVKLGSELVLVIKE